MAISLQDVGRETGQGTTDVSLGAVPGADSLGAFRVAGTPTLEVYENGTETIASEPLTAGTVYDIRLIFPTEYAGWQTEIADNNEGFDFSSSGSVFIGFQSGRELGIQTDDSGADFSINCTFQDGVNRDHPAYGMQVSRTFSVTGGNDAPTASFTYTKSGLTVSVDAGGSSDSDGTIQEYRWYWGDGSPSDYGVTASHTYADGTTNTRIILEVTDDDGASDRAEEDISF